MQKRRSDQAEAPSNENVEASDECDAVDFLFYYYYHIFMHDATLQYNKPTKRINIKMRDLVQHIK